MKVQDKILELIKDVLFPHVCLCGKWGTVLCDECLSKVSKNKRQLCPICKKLTENGKTCSACRHKSNLTGVMVFGKHEGVLKDIIWRYKYEHIRDLGDPISELMIEKFGEFIHVKNFLLVPVPISKERKVWRGYNQAEFLAKKFAEGLNLDWEPILGKKDGDPQVGLSRRARLKNLEGKIYPLNPSSDLLSNKVLIIDDVYTTGSTLEECAKVLRQLGAKEVWGLVISRE